MVIDDFYHMLTPKMRVIVFLSSLPDMPFSKLRELTVEDINNLVSSNEFDISDDMKKIMLNIIDGKLLSDYVFTTPSGRRFSVNRLDSILEKAHERAGVEYKGRSSFSKSFCPT